MKKTKRNIAVISLILAIMGIFVGCTTDYYYKYKGIMKGFNYQWSGTTYVTVAIASEETEFEIDKVSIDCFYGKLYTVSKTIAKSYTVERIGVCVYFYTGVSKYPTKEDRFEDYKNIGEGWYFVERVEYEAYESEAYRVTQNTKHGKKFNHKETFNVPEEMFKRQEGYIRFEVISLLYDVEENFYRSNGSHGQYIQYKITENGKVSIS
jgi:hypothetical protein